MDGRDKPEYQLMEVWDNEMKFSIYKKGQGYYTRLCSGFAGVILAALGCYQLLDSLRGWLGDNMSENTVQVVSAAVALALFAGLSLLTFFLVNAPKCADFMIETEGEMKKVNWPAKKEVISSTKVVIVSVIAMALFIGLVDIVFLWVFQAMGVVKA